MVQSAFFHRQAPGSDGVSSEVIVNWLLLFVND